MEVKIDRERIGSDKQYADELRFRCITDHEFLGPLLGFHRFIPEYHRAAIDLYVKKRPGVPLSAQREIKRVLHLDPRGTFKTTLGIIDTIQWICLDPDVTIRNETATKPLATRLTETQASKFVCPKNKERSIFQLIFPEHVVEKNSGDYNSPARSYEQPDLTIMATSVEASQSGWHPIIFQPDDPVDTENSGKDAKPSTRQRVINNHYTNAEQLLEGGYMHCRGTRYHPQDLWGDFIEKMDPARWKVLVRGAMEVISGRRLQPGEFPAEDEVVLLFPKLISYAALKEKFTADYETFMCQQMNDPQGGGLTIFPPEVFDQVQVEPGRIPQVGEIQIAWRFPYAGKEFMKYAEGVAVRIWQGKGYVIDAWQGNYTPSGLAEKVVRECQKHQAGEIQIEDTPGTRYMQAHIMNEAHRNNLSLRIAWSEFQEDDAERFAQMQQLEPMMRAGRILISTATGKAAELRRQFIHYGMIMENGIVDTISKAVREIPVSVLRTNLEDEELELQRQRREQQMYDMAFGSAGAAALEEEEKKRALLAQAAAMRSVNDWGLPEILGGLDG